MPTLFDSPIEVIKERAEKIPVIVDVMGGYGFTGSDLYYEYLATDRNFSYSRFLPWPGIQQPYLCLVGPKENTLDNYLNENVNIAIPNKYCNLSLKYLENSNLQSRIKVFPGQVEKQIRLNNADLAIDIVQTGKTLKQENLSIYDTLFNNPGLVLFSQERFLSKQNKGDKTK